MGTKQFDSATNLITFTRASSSTFLGSNGLIQTATNNTPRIEYNADGTVKGLLIEEARTNLVTTSSGWNTGATNVSFGGYTTAPDGTNTGSLFITDATGNYSTNLGTVTTSSTNQFVTFSVFFKKELARYATFKINKSAFDGRFWYDFDTGNTGFKTHPYLENRTFSVENYPNGWKRMSISFSSSNISGVFNLNVAPSNDEPYATYNRNITGDGTQGVYFWGAQGELASFPTSYIPTSGSTATRAADVASIATSVFGYNQGVGSLFIEADRIIKTTGGGTGIIANINNGGVADEISIIDSNSLRGQLILDSTGGSNDVSITVSGAEGNDFYAAGWKLNDTNIAHGGVLGTKDTSNIPIKTATTLTLSSDFNNNAKFSGHIKSIKYYPRRLSDTQLQELTT